MSIASDLATKLLEILKEDWWELASVGDLDEKGNFETVEVIEGENRRWNRYNAVITRHKPTDTYLQWGYDEALTENGESEFYDELPVPVWPHKKVVETIEWKTYAP
jgi:hypothetical protein